MISTPFKRIKNIFFSWKVFNSDTLHEKGHLKLHVHVVSFLKCVKNLVCVYTISIFV